MPNITGSVTPTNGWATSLIHNNSLSGALYQRSDGNNGGQASIDASDIYKGWGFDASRSNAIYGAATTVQPPAITVRFIIKY